ncbi:cytoplasmic protein [Escherichia coli]|jgi:hypothetical protein|nr:cytoplasmic protein [Escherichia coli]GCP35243.1 cytoplasmic protein [Escherichia coli]
MTSLKTSIKTITYLSDIGCLEIQGASLKGQRMNNTKKSLKVLFIGESWHIHMIHSKGYDSFTSSKYEEGAPGYSSV